jgi:hypothetical protein
MIITSFSANRTSTPSGGAVLFTWEVTGATSLSINGVTVTGTSYIEHPTADTDYVLTATDDTGSITSPTIHIAIIPPPVISSLTASPSTMTSGGSATLSWASDGTAASFNQGIGSVSPSGSVTVYIGGTATFILTVTGPGGTTTASITVTVTVTPSAPPAPTITGSFNVTLSNVAVNLTGIDIDASNPDIQGTFDVVLKGIRDSFAGFVRVNDVPAVIGVLTPIVRSDTTTLLLFKGSPDTVLLWSLLLGQGVITPIKPYTDQNGLAQAIYDPQGYIGDVKIQVDYGA